MVITVTLNPAMDKTLIIDDFKLGTVNRTSDIRYDIGGKGINVSKVLKNFGIESLALGFLGGTWKSSFEKELDKRGVGHNFIDIEASTRTNTKVVDRKNNVYTDINEAGPVISEIELKKFIDLYSEKCSEGDIVVLSGGIPSSLPKDIYGTLIKIAKGKGAITILDAEGELLANGLKEKPYAIKPNNHELSLLFNKSIDNLDQIIDSCKEIKVQGVENILVSMGSEGATYISGDKKYFAKGLKVPVRSTVGAGDSMVAALVYSIVNKLDIEETLIFAQACGAVTVTLEGTEACKLNDVEAIMERVRENIKEV
jgi:1-phosphofructokinase